MYFFWRGVSLRTAQTSSTWCGSAGWRISVMPASSGV